MNRTIFLLLCTLLIGVSKAERVARILYYQAPREAPKEAFVYQEGAEPAKVNLERYNFSSPFEINSGDVKLLFLPKELQADEKIPSSAPSVIIPADWSKVLLIVGENVENSVMPIVVYPINASPNVFGPGDRYFINYSDVTVQGSIGGEEVKILPKSKEIISKQTTSKKFSYIELNAINPKTKKETWLLKQNSAYNPDYRYLFFVTNLKPPRVAKLYATELRSL